MCWHNCNRLCWCVDCGSLYIVQRHWTGSWFGCDCGKYAKLIKGNCGFDTMRKFIIDNFSIDIKNKSTYEFRKTFMDMSNNYKIGGTERRVI